MSFYPEFILLACDPQLSHPLAIHAGGLVTSAPDSHPTSAGLISSASTGQLVVDQIAHKITFAPNDNTIHCLLH